MRHRFDERLLKPEICRFGREAGANAGALIFAHQLAIFILTFELKGEQILRHDHIAFHADHFGDMRHAAHAIAHALHLQRVPLVPRMMSEWAHAVTGIDIHPGARIGDGFFIDHGTGVVIGETTVIGRNCTLYQGVTLGARRFDRHADGSLRRGAKRHPTLKDGVTVYSNSTILGGATVIGRGATIGAGVWVQDSVPAGATVRPPPTR